MNLKPPSMAAWVVLSAVLAGCAYMRLAPVTYGGATSVVSNRVAEVRLVTGFVTGSSDLMFLPDPTGKTEHFLVAPYENPMLEFDSADQQMFVGSLCSELERLHLFSKVSTLPAIRQSDWTPVSDSRVSQTPAAHIDIIFDSTSAGPSANQVYHLDVRMHIAGGKPFVRRYHVDSNEGRTLWQTINTSAAGGKKIAATRLMNLVVPDIETWINEDLSSRRDHTR